MADQANEAQNYPRVTFSPPLYLQRRIWVFDIMRRYNITDVLDVGCADGEMLCALCNPAPWLPSSYDTHGKFKNFLYPRHIRGLDISEQNLEHAVEFTSPPSTPNGNQCRYTRSGIRWEPLQVDIWKGSLATINEQFIGVDCIISTEVIEHLPEDVLSKFAPTLLGVYHPRLLLVTTPSYTFNPRFSPPSGIVTDSDKRPGGYPDPTGRTTRVFRHHDHKFEWTLEEFADWCNRAAKEWGYHVEIDGVGKPMETDEWGRDDQLGCASQVAIFTRINYEKTARIREEKVIGMERRCDHELLMTHHHTPHPGAKNPLANKDILGKIKTEMERCQDSRLSVRELWNEDEVAVACGGQIESLIDSVLEDGSGEFVLHKAEGNWLEEWHIELVGGVQQSRDLWAEEAQEDDESDVQPPSSEGSDIEERIVDTATQDETLACIDGWGSHEALEVGAWGSPSSWSEPGWGSEEFKQFRDI